MSKAKVYNLAGEVVGEQALNPALFEVGVKPVVVQQAVVAQNANMRRPWAHTKQRAEVRGGGKKPWKQKGTGRARHGSIRSPLWRGGGITFGPTRFRNYHKDINKKTKKKAVQMALSDKLANERIIFVDSLNLPEVKTKQVANALGKLPLKGYKTLFIVEKGSKNMVLSSNNMQDVKTIPAESLNIVDLVNYHSIVIPVTALTKIESLYISKKK